MKILDFGLARPAGNSDLTAPGAIAGTPAYMSPEQARGEVLDARSDLFSLGSILYRMATGRPAFRGENALAVLHAIQAEQSPAPAHAAAAGAAAGLDQLILRLLADAPTGDQPRPRRSPGRRTEAGRTVRGGRRSAAGGYDHQCGVVVAAGARPEATPNGPALGAGGSGPAVVRRRGGLRGAAPTRAAGP